MTPVVLLSCITRSEARTIHRFIVEKLYEIRRIECTGINRQPSRFLASLTLSSRQRSHAARAHDRHASLTRDTPGPSACVINNSHKTNTMNHYHGSHVRCFTSMSTQCHTVTYTRAARKTEPCVFPIQRTTKLSVEFMSRLSPRTTPTHQADSNASPSCWSS